MINSNFNHFCQLLEMVPILGKINAEKSEYENSNDTGITVSCGSE